MRLILILLACCCIAPASAAVALAPDFAIARTGDLLTWRIVDAPAAWLQPDVAVTPRLRVTGADGRTWTRAAYLDQAWGPGPVGGPEFVAAGEPFLSVRHTARTPGRLRWELLAPDATVAATGELAVAPGDGPPGPLGVSPDNPRLLAYADGSPFIAIGPNLAWASTADRAADFARYCRILKAQGATHVRTWFASWSGKVQGDAPDQLRLDHAWLMDRQLEAARANGLRVTLVLENFFDVLGGHGAPYGATPEERVATFVDHGLHAVWLRAQRYVLARWGADDTILAWEPMNEIDMLQPVRERALPWVRDALAWLRANDADGRLRTLSWAGDDWPLAMALPGCDIAQVRGYVFEWTDADWRYIERTRDALAMFDGPFAEAQKLGRPFLLAEVGYQGAERNNRGNDLDADGLLLRQTAWAGLMLGGCGTGMNWWWDVYIDHRQLWPVYGGLSRCAARIDWHDRGLVPLTPNHGGELRILGWTSPTQALLWPTHVNDTWYAAVAQGRARPVPIRPV
jgi:hypothetical protein